MNTKNNQTIVFFNDNTGTYNRRDTDTYMEYLHRIGKYYPAVEEKFISEQVARKKTYLDLQLNSKQDELDEIKLEDRFLFLITEERMNYTNLFYLDSDDIPNEKEIQMMRTAWFEDADWVDENIFNPKDFRDDFEFEYPKPNFDDFKYKDKEACKKHKLSFMLFDFYSLCDPAFQKMIEGNHIDTNLKYLDMIYERLDSEQRQKAEFMYVSKIVDELKKRGPLKDENLKDALKVGDGILRFVENNMDFVDYNDKIDKLSTLAKRNNISFNTTPEELLKKGIITQQPVLDVVSEIITDKLAEEKANKQLEQIQLEKINKAKIFVEQKRKEGYEGKRLDNALKLFGIKDPLHRELIVNGEEIENPDLDKEIDALTNEIKNVQQNRITYVYDSKKLYEYLKVQYEESLEQKIKLEKDAREKARLDAIQKEESDKKRIEQFEKQAELHGFDMVIEAPQYKHFKEMWIKSPADENLKFHLGYLDLNDKVTRWNEQGIEKFNQKCEEINANAKMIQKMNEEREQRNTEKAAKASKGMEM